MTPEDVAGLYEDLGGVGAVAEELGVQESTVHRRLEDAGVVTNPEKEELVRETADRIVREGTLDRYISTWGGSGRPYIDRDKLRTLLDLSRKEARMVRKRLRREHAGTVERVLDAH